MTALLPQLIGLIDLVLQLVVFQLLQNNLRVLLCQQVDDAPRGERLEAANGSTQLVMSCDPVQMVVEDHIAIQRQAFALQEAPRVVDDFDSFGAIENREPGDDGRCDEMRLAISAEAIPRAGHERWSPR